MKMYAAVEAARKEEGQEPKQGIFLTAEEQMDRYLSLGYDIYEMEGKEKNVIATPEEGFLYGRPSFPNTATRNTGRSS